MYLGPEMPPSKRVIKVNGRPFHQPPKEASEPPRHVLQEPGFLRLQDRADLAACRLQLWQAIKAMMTFHSKEAARAALDSELKAIQEYLS